MSDKHINPFNRPFPEDKYLDEVIRLRGLLIKVEKLAMQQEQKRGVTYENSKIAELAREGLEKWETSEVEDE